MCVKLLTCKEKENTNIIVRTRIVLEAWRGQPAGDKFLSFGFRGDRVGTRGTHAFFEDFNFVWESTYCGSMSVVAFFLRLSRRTERTVWQWREQLLSTRG